MSEKWTCRQGGEDWLENLSFLPTKEVAIDYVTGYTEPGDWYEVGRAVSVTVDELEIEPHGFLDLKLARKISEALDDEVARLSVIDREQRFVENFGDRDLNNHLFASFREMIAAHLATHPLYRIVDIERHTMEAE